MTEKDEDPRLIALGTDISDGKSVDWDGIQRDAQDDDTRTLIDNLQRVAMIIEAHRTVGGDVDTEAEPLATANPSSHWRHLVLIEQVGAGAFGTVYRAWDTHLDREVALKLLPKSDPADRDPLIEARHLARIRHTNVVTVYGAEQDDRQVGIWMEFIQGETLDAMVVQRGVMSAREVTGIGVDLCRALSALHRVGLLHRDIKAHNVMREIGGRIVLMDFSVVHAMGHDEVSTDISGTPLYMAPEVVNGGAASYSSDIYSLGVLLFHMLSGRYPVEGANLSEIRAAHARGARTRLPDLRPEVPQVLVQVIERAVSSDPHSRYRTVGELEHALVSSSGAQDQPSAPETAVTSTPARAAWMWPAIAAAALIAVLAGAATMWPSRNAPADRNAIQLTVGPPYNTQSWPRVSPDGRVVSYGTIAEGKDVVWLRPLGSLDGAPLENATTHETIFWSADAKSIGYFDDGKLKTIPIAGGTAPAILADVTNPRGGTWSHDGTIIFSSNDVLKRVSADGSALQQLTFLDQSAGEYQHTWPQFLPDGRHYLFVVRNRDATQSGVWIGSIDSQDRRRVMLAYSRTVYSPSGYLLFVRDGVIAAQRFDIRTMTISGEPQLLTASAQYHSASDAAFDVSNNDVLVYRPMEGPGQPSTRLMLLDRRGREVRAITSAGFHRSPRFSPDGTRLAAERIEPGSTNPDIWLYDLSRGSASRFTTSDAPDVGPVWSPDGHRIAFSSRRGETFDLFVKSVDATEPEQRLDASAGDKFAEHWSPDGKSLAGTLIRGGLWLRTLAPDASPQLLRRSTSLERWQSEFSPDGRWIAYAATESGSSDVFVEPVPATGERWQISSQGGSEPHWRGDGRELIYLATDGRLLGVEVMPGRRFRAGTPYFLFRVSVPEPLGPNDISLSPDGQFVVVNTVVGDLPVPAVHVVVNWPSLLHQ